MVKSLFSAGHDTVIVDSTHLRHKYIERWESSQWEIKFEYFSTSPEVCIERAIKDKKEELIPIIKAMSHPNYDS